MRPTQAKPRNELEDAGTMTGIPLTARRRYQRGSLTKEGDRWLGRWREDVVNHAGIVKRVRRKQVIGTTTEFPTKRMAQRELDRRLAPINRDDYRPTSTITFAEFAE